MRFFTSLFSGLPLHYGLEQRILVLISHDMSQVLEFSAVNMVQNVFSFLILLRISLFFMQAVQLSMVFSVFSCIATLHVQSGNGKIESLDSIFLLLQVATFCSSGVSLHKLYDSLKKKKKKYGNIAQFNIDPRPPYTSESKVSFRSFSFKIESILEQWTNSALHSEANYPSTFSSQTQQVM